MLLLLLLKIVVIVDVIAVVVVLVDFDKNNNPSRIGQSFLAYCSKTFKVRRPIGHYSSKKLGGVLFLDRVIPKKVNNRL